MQVVGHFSSSDQDVLRAAWWRVPPGASVQLWCWFFPVVSIKLAQSLCGVGVGVVPHLNQELTDWANIISQLAQGIPHLLAFLWVLDEDAGLYVDSTAQEPSP